MKKMTSQRWRWGRGRLDCWELAKLWNYSRYLK